MDVLLLRFEAPLMSFGGVRVDQHNGTDPLPYRAMLAGLLANALGYVHAEEPRLASLQSRIRYAARRDRKGSPFMDYQTVDFDPDGPMAADLAWTTRGEIEWRGGGGAGDGTHIRYRHYLADAVVTVALTLDPAAEEPSLRAVSEALRSPARPLFLGRKCCLPSVPLWLGELDAPSLRAAIEQTPRAPRSDEGALEAIWPEAEGGADDRTRLWSRVEDRDPKNDIHVGRRTYVHGTVDPPRAPMKRDHAAPSVEERA